MRINRGVRCPIKLTILWSELASYNIALFRALASTYGYRIQLIYQSVSQDAPYAPFDLSFCKTAYEDSPRYSSRLAAMVEEFVPDAVLMATWNRRHFMRIASRLRQRGVYVVDAMDNQWRSTFKQYVWV
jgi:hypothetical protein